MESTNLEPSREQRGAVGDAARAARDLALVREVLAHPEEAIGRFVERLGCIPRILGAQNARIGGPLNEHDLADLAQEAAILVWRRRGDYDGTAPLEGWAYRICYLLLMNSVRKKRFRSSVVAHVASGALESRPDPAPVEEPFEFEDLYRAMETLPPEEETIVRLKHFDDLTFDEIGEHLELSPNTAKTRYYRARLRLLAQLRRGRDESQEVETT